MKHGRAGMITLLAAAALTAYALAGLASVGAEIDRYGETRSALAERVRELEEANCELEARLNRGRADKNELIEALARERLDYVTLTRPDKKATAISNRGIKSTYAAAGGNGT